MIRVLLLLFAVAYLSACGTEEADRGEKTEYFEFPSKAESSKNVELTLRPVNLKLEIPKSHIESIAHPYKPWAQEIWDQVNIEALIPGLIFKNHENYNDFNEENLDRLLRIRIGMLSSDQSFELITLNGDYEEFSYLEEYNLRSYVNIRNYGAESQKLVQDRGPDVFIVDEPHMVTPSGNPIVINCRIGRCYVSVVIPSFQFPEDDRKDFGGVNGIRIEYDYHKKYLNQWERMHDFVLSTINAYIQYPSIEL